MRLETCLDDDETVTTNMKCLQKVLVNLLKCSMQFTHEGEIVLVVKRCHQQNELSFAVSDTGLGIPEEAKESAFERIRNTDVSIKIVVVRLRLCRALVRLLGGTIYQDPHRKKGTSIVFTIKA
jgi:K+-sensing histidine kinase KdpD